MTTAIAPSPIVRQNKEDIGRFGSISRLAEKADHPKCNQAALNFLKF